MKKKIETIRDVVLWDQCMGCGACAYYSNDVSMKDIESMGIKPDTGESPDLVKALEFCPGYRIANGFEGKAVDNYNLAIGKTLEVWEGYAADEKLRKAASSGGLVSALALYCLEKEDMGFALHSGKDPDNPLRNKTQVSRNYEEILEKTGSRYAPSSPCEGLGEIETADTRGVFIGKPCDAAAVRGLRKLNPGLDKKLGLVVSFFCAGTPGTGATKELIRRQGIDPGKVTDLRYRGNGWPGLFTITSRGSDDKTLTYEESWGFLTKQKPFRCNLCPDGLGEMADLSCGDAWHRFEEGNPGRSLVLVRTGKGREILKKAMDAGYLVLEPSSVENVIKAQGLVNRRRELYGRLLAMRLMGRPVPEFPGFRLKEFWKENSISNKLRIVLGTMRRLLKKGLLKKRDPFKS